MKPIPLAAPDGTIYTYACGQCHNVQGGNFALPSSIAPPSHVAEMAESYRLQAEGCCLCMRCREAPRPQRNPDFVLFQPMYCEACKPIADREFDERMKEAAEKEASYLKMRTEALYCAKDSVSAEKLSELMADLSDDHWCSDWHRGLEHELWTFVREFRDSEEFPTRHWGITSHEIQRSTVVELSDLAAVAGGWWMWGETDGTAGPIFVPMSVWETGLDTV